MNYAFLANLQQEIKLPEKGILSQVLKKDDKVDITLFGFSKGEELSSDSARRRPFSISLREKPKSNWERTRSTPSQVHLSICLQCYLTESWQGLPSKCCSFR
jgi:hypothetical protein